METLGHMRKQCVNVQRSLPDRCKQCVNGRHSLPERSTVGSS